MFEDILKGVNGTVGTLSDIYVKINQQKIDAGMANQTNTIDQLKGTVTLLQQQNQAILNGITAKTETAKNAMFGGDAVKWLLVAGGLFLAYKLVK